MPENKKVTKQHSLNQRNVLLSKTTAGLKTFVTPTIPVGFTGESGQQSS